MIYSPIEKLQFFPPSEKEGCNNCGERYFEMPPSLPQVGDNINWASRDYDHIRLDILEELSARFPERENWDAADIEALIIEILAASLDQYSDMADRVFAEAYLQSARQPSSVRRHLSLVGYDAITNALAQDQIGKLKNLSLEEELDLFWSQNTTEMDKARKEGPKSIRVQHRMVTLNDYKERLEDHPLVNAAKSWDSWTGSWTTIFIATILFDPNMTLDASFKPPSASAPQDEKREHQNLLKSIESFHERTGIPVPDFASNPTYRSIIRPYIDKLRMAGQEVILRDAKPIGILIVLSLTIESNYFASEVVQAATQFLSSNEGGFFAPQNFGFGEDVNSSDIIAALGNIAGVKSVCLIRFKRVGTDYPDQTATGTISLNELEVAVCENNRQDLKKGYFQIKTIGGMTL